MESNSNSSQALECKELQVVLCLSNSNTNNTAVEILSTEATTAEAEVEEVATEEVICINKCKDHLCSNNLMQAITTSSLPYIPNKCHNHME
jgi:hypothetical protein